MDAVLEQWYEKNLDEEIQRNCSEFLDDFELGLVKKLADRALIGFMRHTPDADADVSSIVSHYADCLLQRKGDPGAYLIYSFCVQLYLMSQIRYSPLRKEACC